MGIIEKLLLTSKGSQLEFFFEEIEPAILENNKNLQRITPVAPSSWHKCLTDKVQDIQEFSVSIAEGMRVSSLREKIPKIIFCSLTEKQKQEYPFRI